MDETTITSLNHTHPTKLRLIISQVTMDYVRPLQCVAYLRVIFSVSLLSQAVLASCAIVHPLHGHLANLSRMYLRYSSQSSYTRYHATTCASTLFKISEKVRQ